MTEVWPEALSVLRSGRVEGLVYFLPEGQLDRALYEQVNEVLTRLGGKWDRRLRGHVFAELEPGPLLGLVLDTGEMPPKNPTAYFPTPRPVAEALLNDGALLRIRDGSEAVLEPSAGTGHLADAVRAYCTGVAGLNPIVECCEINDRYGDVLRRKGYPVVARDFLTFDPGPVYDAIVMNPPFAVEGDRLAWVTHIEHARDLLTDGGVLLAVAPNSFQFRENRRIEALRDLVEEHGYWMPVEGRAFAESGTGVGTVLLSAERPPRPPEEPEPQLALFEGGF